MTCFYYQCKNEVCPESDRHCSEHHNELMGLMKLQYYEGIIDFYIESNGGRVRLAGLFLNRNYQRKEKVK